MELLVDYSKLILQKDAEAIFEVTFRLQRRNDFNYWDIQEWP